MADFPGLFSSLFRSFSETSMVHETATMFSSTRARGSSSRAFRFRRALAGTSGSSSSSEDEEDEELLSLLLSYAAGRLLLKVRRQRCFRCSLPRCSRHWSRTWRDLARRSRPRRSRRRGSLLSCGGGLRCSTVLCLQLESRLASPTFQEAPVGLSISPEVILNDLLLGGSRRLNESPATAREVGFRYRAFLARSGVNSVRRGVPCYTHQGVLSDFTSIESPSS